MAEPQQSKDLESLLNLIRERTMSQPVQSEQLREILVPGDLSVAQLERIHKRYRNHFPERDIELVYYIRLGIASLRSDPFSVRHSEVFVTSLKHIKRLNPNLEYFFDLLAYIGKVTETIQRTTSLKDLNDLSSDLQIIKSWQFIRDVSNILPDIESAYISLLSNGFPDNSADTVLECLTELNRMKKIHQEIDFKTFIENFVLTVIIFYENPNWNSSEKSNIIKLVSSLEIHDDFVLRFLEQEKVEEIIESGMISKRSEIKIERYPIKATNRDNLSIHIWKGKIRSNGQTVAIKEYSCPRGSKIPDFAYNEVEIIDKFASSPNHEVFLKYYGSYIEEYGRESNERNSLGIVMEYCEKNLLEEIRAGKDYSEIEFKEIVSYLLDAFAFMHTEGFKHLDIKPENLMRGSDGFIKIIDFNLTIKFDPEEERSLLTGIYENKGTEGFMAPEIQIHLDQKRPGNPRYNPEKADAYSLGMTFLKMYHKDISSRWNTPEQQHVLEEKIRNVHYEWLETLLNRMLVFESRNRLTILESLQYKPANETVPLSRF